jgi:hypothetical protein
MYQLQVYVESDERWVAIFSDPSRSLVHAYAEVWRADCNPHNKPSRISPED